MSLSYETHMLIQQSQIKPYDFLKTIPILSDDTILVFLSQIFMDGDISLFHNLMLFLGQEHQDSESPFIRILNILQNYHDDIYFYVLDQIVPIVLNYLISIQNKYFYLCILHLSNYEPLLTKSMHFLDHSDNLDTLIHTIRETPHLYKPLIYSISKSDTELAEYIYQNIMEGQESNNHTEKCDNVKGSEDEKVKGEEENIKEDENNNHLGEKKKSEVLHLRDENLEKLNNLPNNMIEKSKGLIDQAINNLSNFGDIPQDEIQQQNLENNINSQREKEALEPDNNNRLNTNLIQQVKDESLKQNKKEIKATNFEEFMERIPEEKMELLDSFMNLKDQDAYLALAKNKTYLKNILKPSCLMMNKVINQEVCSYNKLGTNFRKTELDKLIEKIRGADKKPILYFDGMNGIMCDKNSQHLCTYKNAYGDFFYKYEANKFNIKKQMYNLDIWLILFQNLHYSNNVDNTRLGNLKQLYSIVIVVHNYILEQLIGQVEEDSLNIYQNSGFTFVSAGDKITNELLNFYLYSKFFQNGDLLLTSDNYNWLHHGEGISINGKYKNIEEFLPFKIPDIDALSNVLSQLYLNYDFMLRKINLDTIKKKQLTKRKKRQNKKNKRKTSRKTSKSK